MTLLPLLTTVSVTAQAVTFTGTLPGQPPQVLTLPHPLDLSLNTGRPRRHVPQAWGELLTVNGEGEAVAVYRVELTTAAGQDLLIALGFAGPYPVPAGVNLGGHLHGAEVSEGEALNLAGLPNAEVWAFCPLSTGRLTLLWGNAATSEQLAATTDWADTSAASIQAASTPSGSA